VNFTTGIRHGQLLGSKLRSLRKSNRLTLEELSARCVQLDPEAAPSVSYLSMLETGKRSPSPEVLAMIARVFGKQPQWFLDGGVEGNEAAPTTSSTPAATPFEPAFLFSPSLLRTALPELLLQTGTAGRTFAQLLIRVWQETHHNDFPEIERAADTAGGREMPLSIERLLDVCARYGLSVRWVDDDKRRLSRGLARARFEAPGTIVVSSRLRTREARLKYELAFYLGHKILHNGDGAISDSGADWGGDTKATADAQPGLGARDALHAWREFECSYFAGALLLPRVPFRQLLVREAHQLAIHKRLGVGPAVVMRRMTAVSPYRHWHFFDGYPPGYLRTVYRGNGIPLPWGNLSLVPDPCPHWAVFRLLRQPNGMEANRPVSQLSVIQEGQSVRAYACHSLLTRDAADALRVLSVGIDVAPALGAQGYNAARLTQQLWDACQRHGGEAQAPPEVSEALRNVAHVLRIGWVADATTQKARIICSRSQACPRDRRCS
jgi:transcriptional regulator with XRE-family HTH domain